jgi:hypothetical protein
MKYWILILLPTLFLIKTTDIQAHNLVTLNGNAQGHQHVYRRQEYGKPLQQGHVVQASGAGSAVSWESRTRSNYGKLNGRRNGPLIGERYPKPAKIPKVSGKYGAAVNGYGKTVQGYGKPDPDK